MSNNRQAGAVSLFVVIFAMLIITVVTVSFLRLMVNEQQQASDSDLSQSAYDSAQAGVEDAKRALLRYQQVCNNEPAQCADLSERLSTAPCNAALLIGGVINESDVVGGSEGSPGEVMVQQSLSDSDAALNQAYTCVTIELETQDYVGTVSANESQLVPLIGNTSFDTVTVHWFSREDISTTGAISLPSSADGKNLLQQSSWPSNRPSVMRTQLMQFGNSFTLSDFDIVNESSQSNAMTVFLYPTSSGGASSNTFTGNDIRKNNAADEPGADTTGNKILSTQCKASISSGGYACSMSLSLPEPIAGTKENRTAFLRLTPLYNASHFQVVLSTGGALGSGGSLVRFKDVQPIVDSTGRANDLFRRIQSRVDLFDTSFPYPEASIDVTNNFCKDFSVTDVQYIAGSCEP